jgi:leucyl aminopeptidase
MPPRVTLVPSVPGDAEVLAVPVASGPVLAGDGHGLDLDHLVTRGFEAKVGEAITVPGDRGTTLVAVGVGDAADVTPDVLRRAAAAVVRAAWKRSGVALALLDAVPDGGDRSAAAGAVAEGASLAAYRFTRFKSDPDPCRLDEIAIVGADDGLAAAVERAAAVVAATCLARDLVNTPAGDLKPADLADVAVREVTGEGLSVEVLDERAVAEMGLGGLLGVARGSEEPCRLIRMTYDPPGGSDTTVALVGKGITFDSGGLSLKTGEGMMTMKTDMGGGAAVIGTMSALPAIAPPVRVIAFVPTTENMPSGRAMRPGDVLTIRNGKTVEVLNTDAEGRLILADGLSLAVEEGADAIVDLATLTGACMVALGKGIAGLMTNDDALGQQVRDAADAVGEPVWPLPLPAAVPQAPRLAHRRHEEHRQRPPRRAPDRRAVPAGVRRHHALGPPRHRRARRRARRTTARS